MARLLTNDKTLVGLKAGAARYAVRDSLIPGLEVRVATSGVRTWVLRYYAAGQRRRLKLGIYPRMTLHAARKAATAALRAVDGGGDPQADKAAAKAAAVAEKLAAARAERDSIDAVCRDYIERHAKPRKRTWAADAHKINRVILPAWKGRPATSITRRDCRELVQAIADRGAPIQANRVAALLSRLFRFAVDDDVVEHNVADKLPKPGVEITARPEPEREVKPYDDDEIRAIWQATARQPSAARALYRLGLITGQRPGEIGDMAWSEVAGEWWTIPPERAKNGRAHRVYLAPLALKELGNVAKHSPMVFAGYRGKRQLAALNVEVFAGVRRREMPRHAMRDTVATRLAALGVPVDDISRVLNHATGRRVTAGYIAHRFDSEKRAALTRWALVLAGVVDPKKKAAKVVRMTGAAAGGNGARS
jgi:integrase